MTENCNFYHYSIDCSLLQKAWKHFENNVDKKGTHQKCVPYIT